MPLNGNKNIYTLPWDMSWYSSLQYDIYTLRMDPSVYPVSLSEIHPNKQHVLIEYHETQ